MATGLARLPPRGTTRPGGEPRRSHGGHESGVVAARSSAVELRLAHASGRTRRGPRNRRALSRTGTRRTRTGLYPGDPTAFVRVGTVREPRRVSPRSGRGAI